MKIIIIFFSLTLSCMVFSQERHLKMVKKTSGKEKTITIPGKIKIVTIGGNRIRGRLTGFTKNEVIIEQDTVNLASIAKIRVPSTLNRIIGITVGTLGLTTTTGGVALILATAKEGGISAIVGLIVGVPITGTGFLITTAGITIMLIGKKYKDKKWGFEIVQNISP